MAERLKWSRDRRDPVSWLARFLGDEDYFSGLRKAGRMDELRVYYLVRAQFNYQVMGLVGDWVLPFWAERQFAYESDTYHPGGQHPLLDNVSARNWVVLPVQGAEELGLVDPRGLVTPAALGFSLDFWLRVGDKLVYPSREPGVNQSLYRGLPVVETALSTDNFLFRSWVWASRAAGQPVVQGLCLLRSRDGKKKVSLCPAIRPFNPEGVHPVAEVEYLEPGLVCVDHRVGLVVGREPDRVVAGNLETGDLGGLDSKEQSLSRASCPRGLATIMLEFRPDREGKRGEIYLPWSIPLVPLKPGRKKAAGKLLLPGMDRPEEIPGRISPVLRDKRVVSTQDKVLTAALAISLERVLSRPWSRTPPLGYDRKVSLDPEIALWSLEVLYRADRLEEWLTGWRAFARLVNKKGFIDGCPGRWDLMGLAVHQAGKAAPWLSESALEAEVIPVVIRLLNALESGGTGAGPGLMPARVGGRRTPVFGDAFWGAAAFESAAEMLAVLGREGESDRYREKSGVMWEKIKERVSIYGPGAMPAGPGEKPGLSMVANLAPLCFLDPPAPVSSLLKPTVLELFKLSPFENLLPGDGPAAGISISRSLLATAALVKLGSPLAMECLESILKLMGDSFCFPEVVNPKTGLGCSGDGHGFLNDILLAVVIMDLFLREDGDSLRITPVPLVEWFNEGENIVVTDRLTRFGRFGYRVDGLPDRIILSLEPEYRVPPEHVTITVPFYPGGASVDNVEVVADTRTMELGPEGRKASILRQEKL